MKNFLRKKIDTYLSYHPRQSRPYNGVVTQITSVTDVANRTRLKHGLGYIHDWVLDTPPNSLCDLGCNSGLFPLWILAQTGHHIKKGLYVDANMTQVIKCKKNLELNMFEMFNQRCVTGLVGEEEGTSIILKSSHQSSNCYTDEEGYLDYPPAVDPSELWGDVEGDLLKVDIEGSEFGFLTTEINFITCFKNVIIEYHEPVCDVSYIRHMMPSNFKLHFVTGLTCGNTYWERQ